MGTDFYSWNRVVLVGQVFRMTELSKDRAKKTLYIRLGTKEVFLYGRKKTPGPTKYYHFIRVSGSLAVFCTQYIAPGDLILIEGRLRNFPVKVKDQQVWKSIVWADKIITLTKKEWLSEERKQKADLAIDQFKK